MNSMRDAAVLLVLVILALSVRVSDRAEAAQTPTSDLPQATEAMEATWEVDAAPEAIAALPAELVSEELSRSLAELRINDERIFVLHSRPTGCGETPSVLRLDTGDGNVLVLELGSSLRKQLRKRVARVSLDKA